MSLPKHAILELTYRCNQNCKFCYGIYHEKAQLFREELSIDEWIALVDGFITQGVESFTLTGGEVMLKKDLICLLHHLSKYKEVSWSLFTNGAIWDEDIFDLVAQEKSHVSTSLVSGRCGEELTQSGHNVYKMIDFFAKLERKKIYFDVSIPVMKTNYKEVKNLAFLAQLSGARSVQVNSLLISGNAKKNPELWLTYPEIERLGKIIEKLEKKLSIPIVYSNELYCSCRKDFVIPPETPPSYEATPCTIEQHLRVVDPYGNMRKCLHIDN